MDTLHQFLDLLAQPMGLVGMLGQLLFTCRFVAQWVASEKKKESTVPVVFWYLSFSGGVLLLIYALWQLGDFQKQERVWRGALDRARLLAPGKRLALRLRGHDLGF